MHAAEWKGAFAELQPQRTSLVAFSTQGISAPTLQSALNYLLLALCYSHIHLRKQPRWLPLPLSKPWWTYALLALLDVEANFLLVRALQGSQQPALLPSKGGR